MFCACMLILAFSGSRLAANNTIHDRIIVENMKHGTFMIRGTSLKQSEAEKQASRSFPLVRLTTIGWLVSFFFQPEQCFSLTKNQLLQGFLAGAV